MQTICKVIWSSFSVLTFHSWENHLQASLKFGASHSMPERTRAWTDWAPIQERRQSLDIGEAEQMPCIPAAGAGCKRQCYPTATESVSLSTSGQDTLCSSADQPCKPNLVASGPPPGARTSSLADANAEGAPLSNAVQRGSPSEPDEFRITEFVSDAAGRKHFGHAPGDTAEEGPLCVGRDLPRLRKTGVAVDIMQIHVQSSAVLDAGQDLSLAQVDQDCTNSKFQGV